MDWFLYDRDVGHVKVKKDSPASLQVIDKKKILYLVEKYFWLKFAIRHKTNTESYSRNIYTNLFFFIKAIGFFVGIDLRLCLCLFAKSSIVDIELVSVNSRKTFPIFSFWVFFFS